MRTKTAFLCVISFFLNSCALFRGREPSYPKGVIFPLVREDRVGFQGEVIDSVHREGEILYLATQQGYVHAVQGRERKILWSTRMPGPLKSPLSVGSRGIYVVGRDETVYGLTREGKISWRSRAPSRVTTPVLEMDGKVFFGTDQGLLAAFDAASGRDLWHFQAGDSIMSNPVRAGRNIALGCEDGFVYIVNTSGYLVRKLKAGAPVRSSLFSDGSLLVFVSEDEKIHCYELERYGRKWVARVNGSVRVPPLAQGRTLFVLTWNGVLFGLDKNSGTVLWWNKVPSRSRFLPQVVDDKIVVASFSSRLVCFTTKDGQNSGVFEASGEIRSNPLWMEPHVLITLFNPSNEAGSLVFLKKEVKAVLEPSVKSPQKPKSEILLTATPTGFFMPEFEFYLKKGEEKTVAQARSDKNTWFWYPAEENDYVVGVTVSDDKEKAEAEIPFIVRDFEVVIIPSVPSPHKPGVEVVFTVQARGFNGPQFEFYTKTETDKQIVQSKSEKNSYAWTPDVEGSTTFGVTVSDDKISIDGETVFDVKKVYVILTASPESPRPPESEIVFTAEAEGLSEPQFEFFLKTGADEKAVGEKSGLNTWTWKPDREGSYTVRVKASDSARIAEAQVSYVVRKEEPKTEPGKDENTPS